MTGFVGLGGALADKEAMDPFLVQIARIFTQKRLNIKNLKNISKFITVVKIAQIPMKI